jgi:hypothetical protein
VANAQRCHAGRRPTTKKWKALATYARRFAAIDFLHGWLR